jgi:hypothetical protein
MGTCVISLIMINKQVGLVNLGLGQELIPVVKFCTNTYSLFFNQRTTTPQFTPKIK